MNKKYFFKKTLLTVSMGIALGLYGCGGGSSSISGETQETVNTGVFIDAPVKGLQYSTATQSGVTNEQGEFTYKAGESVLFRIDGLEIGTVAGASEIPVTALPQYIDVARLLQSLDIDALEELIDITGITIPDSLKNQLKDLIENNQGDFDTVLTQAQLDSIVSNSQVQLVNATPVSEEDAIKHITGSISENLTDNDFNRQTYIDIDESMVLSFEDDGTGFEFNDGDGGSDQPYKAPFAWSVTNNKLDVNYTNGGSVNVSLLSVNGNEYVIAGSDPEEGSFITTLNKVKSLSISALDGKILSFDTSTDPDCTARTIKITGTTGLVKEQCTGGYFEETVTLSDASSLDNAIYVRGNNPTDGNFSTKIHLVEGSITDGKYVFIDEPQNNAPDDVFFVRMYETDNEATPATASITVTETITEVTGFTELNPKTFIDENGDVGHLFCRTPGADIVGTEEVYETLVTVVPDDTIIRLTFSEEGGETEVDEATYSKVGNILSFNLESTKSGPSPVSGFSFIRTFNYSANFNLLTNDLSGQAKDINTITYNPTGDSVSCTTKRSITTESN